MVSRGCSVCAVAVIGVVMADIIGAAPVSGHRDGPLHEPDMVAEVAANRGHYFALPASPCVRIAAGPRHRGDGVGERQARPGGRIASVQLRHVDRRRR